MDQTVKRDSSTHYASICPEWHLDGTLSAPFSLSKDYIWTLLGIDDRQETEVCLTFHFNCFLFFLLIVGRYWIQYMMDFMERSSALVTVLLWVYALGSWCMCSYVVFASCEGPRWFSVRRNPLLIAGAAAGLLHVVVNTSAPPCTSIAITCIGWTAYSALVTFQHGKFRLWSRHILPVNAPTLVLLWWFAQRC